MPFCTNCGTQMADTAQACPQCGHPGPRPQGGVAGARRTEGTAVASLVLGIAGLVVCPLICSILAVIFGSQAQGRIRADPSLEGEGMAKAGSILGWVGIGLTAIGIVVFVFAFLVSAGSSFGLELR